jgi:hypothetical protein
MTTEQDKHPLCLSGVHSMPEGAAMFDVVDVFICELCGEPVEAGASK